MKAEKWTDAERREVAGMVAPVLRQASPKALGRRAKVYDRATGEVVGETTVGAALEALATIYGLEHAVAEGVPDRKLCEYCGRAFEPRKKGRAQRLCGRCPCDGCGVVMNKSTVKVAFCRGKRAMCMQCSPSSAERIRRTTASRTREQRAEAARKGRRTREQRADASRKAEASR